MTTCGMGRHATRLRNGLLMAVSALVLNGCVSASGDLQSEDDAALSQATPGQQEQAQAGEDGAVDGYRDPMVNAGRGSAGGEGPSARSGTGSGPSEPSNFADAVMQPAQVNANQTSIFASAAPAASSGDTPAGDDPDPSGRAITNLYQANPGALPASGATTGSIPAASGSPAAPGTPPAFDEEASIVPDHVPVPTSVRSALVAGDEAKAREVPRWRESSVFTPLERQVMEYAEAMCQTPVAVTDELSDALLAELGPAALLELGARVGLMNATARGNIALGIRSEHFADACGMPALASRTPVGESA